MDKSLRLIGNFLFMNDAFCIITKNLYIPFWILSKDRV